MATIETSLKAPVWKFKYIKVPAKMAAAAPITRRMKVSSFIMKALNLSIKEAFSATSVFFSLSMTYLLRG